MKHVSIKTQAVFWVLVLLLFASCAGSVYSHYPKVKSKQTKQEIGKPFPTKKVENIAPKNIVWGIQTGSYNLPAPAKPERITAPLRNKANQVREANKKETVIAGSGRPDDVTPVNKKAKTAFWFSIAALGSLAGGLALAPVLLVAMFLLSIAAFVYAIKALKRIKRTGEYGKPKAEFALFVSIPLLFFSLIVIWAILSLKAGGGGIQLGDMTFFN